MMGVMVRLLLFLAFLVVPVLEIWVLIRTGQVIGGWQTIGLLMLAGLLGSWLVRREGRRTWAALRAGIASGRMPDRELADGALVVAGGVLLLTPGLLSDVLGFVLILPVTRPLARRALGWFLDRRMRALAAPYAPGGVPFAPFIAADPDRPGRGAKVVPGEVVEDTTAGETGRRP